LKYLYEASVARRGAHVHAESSAGRVSSPVQANGDDEGVDAVPPEYDALVLSLVHDSVREDVLDARMAPGPSEIVVKEVVLDAGFPASPSDKDVKDVDHAAGPSGEGVEEVVVVACPSVTAVEEEGATGGKDPNLEDFEAKNASPAKTHEEEASVTEIIESDGMYDSQGTEILPRSRSSVQGT
jgi:hypothetical protein